MAARAAAANSATVLAPERQMMRSAAAKRAGIMTVILPRQNAKNIREDLTEELRRGLTVHYVDEMDEVLKLALLSAAAPAGRLADNQRPEEARRLSLA